MGNSIRNSQLMVLLIHWKWFRFEVLELWLTIGMVVILLKMWLYY